MTACSGRISDLYLVSPDFHTLILEPTVILDRSSWATLRSEHSDSSAMRIRPVTAVIVRLLAFGPVSSVPGAAVSVTSSMRSEHPYAGFGKNLAVYLQVAVQ